MKTLTSNMQAAMRRAGLIAGLGLLLMSILAGLATFGVLDRLVTEGDASRTTSQILAAFGTFRLAILALFLIAVLDLVVAWALWVFFDHVHHVVAIVAACCRGVYAAIFAVAISHLLAAARLLSNRQPDGLADHQLQLELLAEIERFYDIWSLGLGLFGFHLLLIGWLAFTSSVVPRVVGVLVAIAGAGYLIDSAGGLLSATYTFELASVTFIGEVVLMVWLLMFAVRRPLRGLDSTTFRSGPLEQ
jgi:ABC-type multidrug transport system fused ATPase/permease subunit